MTGASYRTSVVGEVKINAVLFSSAVFAGDMVEYAPKTLVLAIQREVPNHLGNEGSIEAFPIFSAEIPQPLKLPGTELSTVNESPFIRVGSVRILSVSTCGLFHMGSNRFIREEARIKHIRQLLTGERRSV